MKTIFFDVDTQKDFTNKDGALYVPGAEDIKLTLSFLTVHASVYKIKVFGSVDRHFGTHEHRLKERELKKWGGPFPEHCMDNTEGIHKIKETIINSSFFIASEDHLLDKTIVDTVMNPGGQFIGTYFEKQSYDVATNPMFNKWMKYIKPDEVYIYGVAENYCVYAAAMAFRKLGVKTFVISDATRAVDLPPGSAEAKRKEMKDAGVIYIKSEEILEEDCN